MRIALINVSGPLSTDGSRLVSALLKRAGHSVRSVFLARRKPLDYESDELKSLDAILRETDLVMVAVYSSYANRAVQVTEFVHRKYPGMRVIWGGPHCISSPEFSLRHADGVCYSEGDQVVIDFVSRMESGMNYFDTPNMAFNVDGTPVVNPVLPPFSDLDTLPYYDYDLDDQFLLDRDLFPMTRERLRESLAGYPYHIPILYFITSRGCPYECSYCNNCRYVTMFGGNTMRFHSIRRVIDELEHTLAHLDFFRFVGFGDDDFLMRPKEQLEDFAHQYKKRVGLPFGIAVSARTHRREKMEILLDSGLRVVQMGLQSASQRTLDEVYNRKIKMSKAREVVQQIEPYHQTHGLDFLLDFIIDNPYETPEDIIQTYRYLVGLPIHLRINMFFLAFFPGTPIYDRAVKDGIIQPFNEREFRFFNRGRLRYQFNYETFLVFLVRCLRRHQSLLGLIPRSVLFALGSRPARFVASIFPRPFFAFLSQIVQ